jgi:hypothetical protein
MERCQSFGSLCAMAFSSGTHPLTACVRWPLVAVAIFWQLVYDGLSSGGNLLAACVRWSLVAVAIFWQLVYDGLSSVWQSFGSLCAMAFSSVWQSFGSLCTMAFSSGGNLLASCVRWPLVAVAIFWQLMYDGLYL